MRYSPIRVMIAVTAALAAIFSTPLVARAATYYVAPTGNDSNVCTSTSSPCRTIGHAVSLAGNPGDIVQVAAGIYAENLTLSHSGGSASTPITVRGQDGSGCPTTAVNDVNHPTGVHPASKVTVQGHFTIAASNLVVDCFHFNQAGLSNSQANDGIDVSMGITNVTISNNEIQNNGGANGGSGGGITWSGITSADSSHFASNMIITRNYIHSTSNGLFILCNSCMVTDNEIYDLQGDEPGSDHDYIDAWGNGTVFRHNYMHGNTCNSCQGYDCHMDCIQTFNTTGDGTEVSKNITFDRNVCFNNHEGVIVQDNAGNGDISDWTVTNNVFAYPPYDDGSGHLCAAGAAHPWCWVFEDGKLGSANKFANNTCVDGAEGFRSNSGSAVYQDNLYYSASNQTSVYQNQGATVTGANNLYFAANGKFGSGMFPGDIFDRNPQITSLGTGNGAQCIGCNFNIGSTSAARDAGVSTGVGSDLLGTTRPQGSAYDVGAYEFISSTTAQQPAAPTNLTGAAH